MLRIGLTHTLLTTGLFWMIASGVWADTSACDQVDSECVAVGEWDISLTLGLGERTNPLVDSDDQMLVLLPQVSWYGRRFFWNTLEGGFTFFENERHTFNALVTLGLDQIYFDDFGIGNFVLDRSTSYTPGSNVPPAASPPGEPQVAPDTPPAPVDPEPVESEPAVPADIPISDDGSVSSGGVDSQPPRGETILNMDRIDKRDLAVLAGFEYGFHTQFWRTNLQVLQDVSSVHRGFEVRLATSKSFYQGKNNFVLAAGLTWQSKALLDYYYGLEEHEVGGDDRLLYEARAGISQFVKFSWNRKLSESWSFQGTLHHKRFDSALRKSPLLEEDSVTTVFMGVSYHF